MHDESSVHVTGLHVIASASPASPASGSGASHDPALHTCDRAVQSSHTLAPLPQVPAD